MTAPPRSGSKSSSEPRAAAVQIPVPTRALQQERKADQTYRLDRERVERRSMVRGLILLALLVLAASIARAGLHRVFVHPWW